jgi:ribosome-binding ATPase
VTIAEHIRAQMDASIPARAMDLDEDGKALIKDMFLLTAKPVLYLLNVDEESVHEGNAFTQTFIQAMDENAEILLISAGIEADIAQLESREERAEFLEAMGLEEPGVNRVIHAAYHLLNLITYFTAGEKEVRAWTIQRGWKAPQAAGVIHTDFEKGFIRAEVIKYDVFLQYGSEQAVKEAGKMAVEGKEYVVGDGDVMHFRFNV